LERIQSQWPVVEEIRNKCGVGSISVGVLHQGEVLFTGSTGYREVAKQEKADTSTLYTLCSISKSFVAAAVGILVDRGMCKWEDPVGPYLPEFIPKGDPRVAAAATFNDFLRQSGGLANPIVNIIGPEGKVLVQEGEFISVLNDTPTGSESFGPYFNAAWEYSNVAYGLVGLVIERLSGQRYADFVSQEILKPLGMNDTVVYKSQLALNSNVARSYVRLSDGSWFEQPEHEWTDELNTPLLSMIGIRSSVKDLLIWCAATMNAYWGDASSPQRVLSGLSNPLREVGSILDYH
jgi:CubicO group peptidase (beta-lactamase class C family)